MAQPRITWRQDDGENLMSSEERFSVRKYDPDTAVTLASTPHPWALKSNPWGAMDHMRNAMGMPYCVAMFPTRNACTDWCEHQLELYSNLSDPDDHPTQSDTEGR